MGQRHVVFGEFKCHSLKLVLPLLLLVMMTMLAQEATCQENVATTDALEPAAALKQRPVRLPNTTFPLEYHLHIASDIHLGNLNFKGNMTIDIEIKETTDEIVLHATNLSNFVITATDLETNAMLRDLTYTLDIRRHFIIIHAMEYYQIFEVDKRYRLEILYEGVMNEYTSGLYWLAYRNASNEIIYHVATQFEPASARLAIPCYDEPAFKANFTIRLTHGQIYNAISNMPVRQVIQDNDSDLVTTIFYKTPPISTYLVAFVISNFEYIFEKHGHITHRVFTPLTAKNKGELQLKFAVDVVEAFENYLGVKYPLDKLDHVALNKNYGAAMENWGLITYREDCLLYSDYDLQQRVKDTITIAHEISHQWFGNLVSPEWWTYAWLNEGFATYFSHVIIDMLYPEFKAMEYFIMDSAFKAYSYPKYTRHLKPMTHYVEEQHDIISQFELTIYQKAACVIKMFHHAFGQQTFVRGVQIYLTKYQYTVANERDLFACLQQALEENEETRERSWIRLVPDILYSWTHSTFMPMVKVIRNYDDNTVTIRQEPFQLWVPLNFASASDHNFSQTTADYFMPPIPVTILKPEDLGISIKPDDWLIVNKQQTGFYNVLYDKENLRRISLALQENHFDIHAFNRAELFQTLETALVRIEIESADLIFELLKYLHREDSLIVWHYALATIEVLDNFLDGTASHEPFKQFIRYIIGPIYRKYFPSITAARQAITEKTGSEHITRQNLLRVASSVDLPECVDYARQLAFDYIFLQKNFVNATEDYYTTTDVVLCSGLRYISDEEFNDVVQALNSSMNTMFFDDIFIGLRCTQNPSQIKRYLDMIFGLNITGLLSNHDASIDCIGRLLRKNRKARTMMWQYIGSHYKTLIQLPYFVDIFNRLAEYVPTNHLSQFREFYQKISWELKSSEVNYYSQLIEIDSKDIGRKIDKTELFLKTFGTEIHDWLMRNQRPMYAASTIAVRNGGPNRFGKILRLAGNLYSKLFSHK